MPAFPRSNPSRAPKRATADFWLSLALLVGGFLLMTYARVRDPNALAMLPSLDGCLTVGIVSVLLGLLHGLPYRTALFLALPVVGVQIGACRAAGVSFLPMLGLELLVVGLFGLPFARIPGRRRASRAPGPAPAPRDHIVFHA